MSLPTPTRPLDEQAAVPPLPSADELRQYDEIVPGAASEILRNYEEQLRQMRRLHEHYALYRTMIKHENELINHRMTWLIVASGFIGVAFSLIASTNNTAAQAGLILVGVLFVTISTLGLLAVFRSQRVLARHMREHFRKLEASPSQEKEMP